MPRRQDPALMGRSAPPPEPQAANRPELATPLTMKSLATCPMRDRSAAPSTLATPTTKLCAKLVIIGKQFLYVERYMKLLAPRWQMMSDPEPPATSLVPMAGRSVREHQSDVEV